MSARNTPWEALHGGIAAAILDEAIRMAVTIGKDADIQGVTLEFSI